MSNHLVFGYYIEDKRGRGPFNFPFAKSQSFIALFLELRILYRPS